MAPKKKSEVVIEKPDFRVVEITLQGTTPLLCHAWSEKARRQMAKAQDGSPKTRKRDPRDPQAEFEASVMRDKKGRPLFKAVAFKKAAVAACRLVDGLTMVTARQLFRVIGDYVVIESPNPPVMDEDCVRLDSGAADLRYRARFDEWSVTLKIRYLASATSAEQILNLLLLAGECVGVGEKRAEKCGDSYGCFTIAEGVQAGRKAA